MNIVAANRAFNYLTSNRRLWIIGRTSQFNTTGQPPLNQIILLVQQGSYRVDISILYHDIPREASCIRIDSQHQIITALILLKAELIYIQPVPAVFNLAMDIGYRLPITICGASRIP